MIIYTMKVKKRKNKELSFLLSKYRSEIKNDSKRVSELKILNQANRKRRIYKNGSNTLRINQIPCQKEIFSFIFKNSVCKP